MSYIVWQHRFLNLYEKKLNDFFCANLSNSRNRGLFFFGYKKNRTLIIIFFSGNEIK